MDTEKNVLKKTIMVLEWDKRHGQLNPGRKALLEEYIKKLGEMEAQNG